MRALWTTALLVAITALGCGGPQPPASWPTGGTRLDLPRARWTYNGDQVEIRSNGEWADVYVDGDLEYTIDRVGRVYGDHKRPFAVLESDGRLVGRDDVLVGMVGSVHAALPGRANAWVSVMPNGQVLHYDRKGRSESEGQWIGCNYSPYAAQTCVLVSYLLFYADEGPEVVNQQSTPMMSPGFGTTMYIQ
jgi:hypothetical protein